MDYESSGYSGTTGQCGFSGNYNDNENNNKVENQPIIPFIHFLY